MNAEPSQEFAARDRELAEIAKSIASLAELFKDLSVLVIDQGTLLDSVEYNIEQTAVQMEDAVTELKIATGYVLIFYFFFKRELEDLLGIRRIRENGNAYFCYCLSSLVSLLSSSLNPNDIILHHHHHLRRSRASGLIVDAETFLHLYPYTPIHGLDCHRLSVIQ